jgi:hypothetical protein
MARTHAKASKDGGFSTPFSAADEIIRDEEEAVALAKKPAQAMERLRIERDALLVSSDWTQSPDSPLTDEVKASWTTYRQELRDLPASTADPANPTWPGAPE